MTQQQCIPPCFRAHGGPPSADRGFTMSHYPSQHTLTFVSSLATVPSVTSDEVMASSRKLWSFSSSWAELDPDVSMTM